MTTNAHRAAVSKADGDLICAMVLRLVTELATPRPLVREPTGARVDRDMEQYVTRRAS